MGLAIATAVTGLVLAGGASVASLVGWIGPAHAVTSTVQANTSEQASLSANTFATPQVVLVPIAPMATTSAQLPATGASLAGAETSNGPSTATGVFVASRHTEDARSQSGRMPRGERDDD
jgi:hypothetical protein